jgi:Ca-activated chloride channel family protein
MLWLLLILPFGVLLLWLGSRRKASFLKYLSDTALFRTLPSRIPALQSFRLHSVLLTAAILSLVLALADPRIPYGERKLKTGVLDVIMLIDVSQSMLAEDYAPQSRLAIARHTTRQLVAQLEGNRIGLVTFAGSSFRQAELTEDYQALEFIVDHWIKVNAAGIGGSDLVNAIATGLDMYEPSRHRKKLMLILSDGGPDLPDLQPVLTKATHQGVKIVTFGLGNAHPARIPQYDQHHTFTGYLRVDGKVVTTRLNETPLKRIALSTRGAYHHITRRGMPPNPFASVLNKSLQTRQETQIFQVFLFAGLILCGLHTVAVRI